MSIPLIAGLGPQELIIIAVVLVLLFGAKKLPELARGSGQALRIFKAETKGLDEDDDKKTPEQRDSTRATRRSRTRPRRRADGERPTSRASRSAAPTHPAEAAVASPACFGLYRAKPQNPVGDDGRMALADHFRELRARLLRAITVLIVAIIVALVLLRPDLRLRHLALPRRASSSSTAT